MDGLAATTKIRQKETSGEGLVGKTMKTGPRAGNHLPIVVVTANVRKEQIDTAIAAGAVRHLDTWDVDYSANACTGSCYAEALQGS